MPDRVRLARCHPERDGIVVLGRQRVRQVRLGARARHPQVLRRIERASEDATLLEVGHRARVVSRAAEGVELDRRCAADVCRDVVVLKAQAIGLPDVAEEAGRLLIDVVPLRARHRRPGDCVVGAVEQQVARHRRLGRGQRLVDANRAHGCDLVLVGRRHWGAGSRRVRGRHAARRRQRGDERDRRQRPRQRPQPAQLARRMVRMHQGEHVRRLDVVDVEEIGLGVGVGDLVGHRAIHQRGALRVEAEVTRAELDHHRLVGRVGERDQARFLRRVLYRAHEGEARAVGNRPVRQHDEVAAERQAGLVFHIVDSPEELGRDDTATERALQGADVRHLSAPRCSAWSSRRGR